MIYSQIKIRDLELLIAIGEECNLREAARRVGISEPALSKRLRLIERRVHVNLFSRNAEGLASTPPGQAFLDGVRISVQLFHQALHDANQLALGEVRKIRVGVSSDQGVRPMALIRSISLPTNKSVHYEISVENATELIAGLQNHQIDVAMVTSPLVRSSITTARLFSHPFMIAMRPDHPLADANSLRLEDIAQYPWILFSRSVHPPLHDLICERAREKGIAPRILHSVCGADQASALLTDDSTLVWLMPSAAESALSEGLVNVKLDDAQIRVDTLLATRASNRSRLIGEFCRGVVKAVEAERYKEQLQLPIA